MSNNLLLQDDEMRSNQIIEDNAVISDETKAESFIEKATKKKEMSASSDGMFSSYYFFILKFFK